MKKKKKKKKKRKRRRKTKERKRKRRMKLKSYTTWGCDILFQQLKTFINRPTFSLTTELVLDQLIL